MTNHEIRGAEVNVGGVVTLTAPKVTKYECKVETATGAVGSQTNLAITLQGGDYQGPAYKAPAATTPVKAAGPLRLTPKP